MENNLLSIARTICHISFSSTGITTPTDEHGFFHMSSNINDRLRIVTSDLNVSCAAYLYLPVVHTELKIEDMKSYFPECILHLVRELAPLKRATCPSGKVRFDKELDALSSSSDHAISIRLAEYLSSPSRFLRMMKKTERKDQIVQILSSRKCTLSHQLSLLIQANETVVNFKNSRRKNW